MPDKEKDWNYYFTIILLFFTIYTVLKDALVALGAKGIFINLFTVFIYSIIGALFVTWFAVRLIKNHFK